MATVYPFRQPADPMHGANANHGPSPFLDQSLSAPHYSAPYHNFNLIRGFLSKGLETHLRQFEVAAQEKLGQSGFVNS